VHVHVLVAASCSAASCQLPRLRMPSAQARLLLACCLLLPVFLSSCLLELVLLGFILVALRSYIVYRLFAARAALRPYSSPFSSMHIVIFLFASTLACGADRAGRARLGVCTRSILEREENRGGEWRQSEHRRPSLAHCPGQVALLPYYPYHAAASSALSSAEMQFMNDRAV
jgi:hypothetical protein